MQPRAAEISDHEREIVLQRLVQIIDGNQAVVAVDLTLLEDALQQLVGKRGQPVEQSRRNHAPNASGNFCFEVTLGYRRCERPRRAGGSV